MRPDQSFRVYPRLDNDFKQKDSLDIQRVTGNLYGKRPTGNKVQAYLWCLCFIIGLLMGTIAFLIDITASELVALRWWGTEKVARSSSVGLGWLVLVLISAAFIAVASLLSVYVASAAIGSGVAEAMGILNGVSYPDYICLKTLAVKSIGVAFGVAGGLCGGKEGPLVHIGSIVGYASAYLPIPFTKYFRNDFEKRKLMAVGTAAGVAAAFGAPIGGSLFAYELSKPNTFWSFSLTWKVFFASTISTFVLSVLKQLYDNKYPIYVSSAEIVKLGASQKEVTMDSLVAALIIGVSGGLIGAFFIRINNKINYFRKRFLKQKWMKISEALFLAVLTSSVFYIAAYLRYNTSTDPNDDTNYCQVNKENVPSRQFLCKDGTFDRLATLLFENQSNTIKTFMSDQREILLENAAIFTILWFIFLCITSGVAAPLGIFIPCILIGCGLGHMYFHLHYKIFTFEEDNHIKAATFATLGATAVLAGSTRMTYSLAVIMLETTSSVDIFLPIIFTLFISYGSGTLLINKSIYLSALRSKNIPLLTKNIPKQNRNKLAKQVMSSPARHFNFIVNIKEVVYQLTSTRFNGFPVVNGVGRVVGLIERDVLVTLIQKEAWYDPEESITNVRESKVADFEGNLQKNNQDKNLSTLQSINNNVADDDDEQYMELDKTDQGQDLLMVHDEDLLQRINRSEYQDNTDFNKFPLQEDKIKWWELNQDFKSNQKNIHDVLDIANDNLEKTLDLRPYMIDRPYTVCLQDKFTKIMNVFKLMQLRQLIVINESNGHLEGIITRQDLFQYMSL
eukprot:403365093